QNDAEFENNPIVDPDEYIATIGPGQTQVIYVRVNSPDCYGITTFELIIHPEIVFTPPTDYDLCDDAVADGSTQFDLNTKVTQMTNNDPNLDVTFHDDPTDADTGASPLPLLYTSDSKTIYVRIVDTNTGCYVVTQFELIVNPNPVPGMVSDMMECDLAGAGTFPFDLTIPEAEILNGQTGMTVTFYNAAGTQLTSPYTNTNPTETITFRLEDDLTECFTTGTFTIE